MDDEGGILMNAYAPDPALTSDTSSNRAYIPFRALQYVAREARASSGFSVPTALILHLLYNELDKPID